MNEVERSFDLLYGKLLGWFRQLVVMLPNLAVAGLLLVLTFVAARLVQRVVRQVLPRVSSSVTLNNLLATIVYIITLVVGIFFVLSVLNLDKTVTSLLAGVGIIGLALGFAFQDIAANFISGVIIAVQRPFNVGDVIETDKFFGTIERISLRTLNIRQTTGELVIMPNRKVFENPLINFTQQTMRRVDLDCQVAYSSDLEKVRTTVHAAISSIPELIAGRPIEVMFTAFGESAITFQVRFWMPYRRQFDYVSARSEAIMRIKQAFDTQGIVIPFPIRTLHLPAEAPALRAPTLPNAAGPGANGHGRGEARPAPGQ